MFFQIRLNLYCHIPLNTLIFEKTFADFKWSLSVPKPRTNNMKNSFMYDGANLRNSIPKEIRESKSLFSFRNKIAAHIYE